MKQEIIQKVIFRRLVLFLTISILFLNSAYIVVENFVKKYSGEGRLEISAGSHQDGFNGPGGSIYLQHVLKLRTELEDCDIAYTSETDCILENGNKRSTARLVMTDDVYSSFSGLEIIKGSFINYDACKSGRNLAVISETTARELYSSYNIMGSEIEISGVKYRISGIYRSKQTLLSFLGADGMNRVYVPLESRDNYEKQAVGTIYVTGETIAEDEFKLHTLDEILLHKLFINTAEVRISDYYGLHLTMRGILAFCIFCAGIYIIWIAVSGAFRVLKAICLQIKRNGENYYLLDSVKVCRLDILKSGVVVLLQMVMALAAFLAVRFTPYLPSQIIPQENIFDFGFYAVKVKEAIEVSNLSVFYCPSRLAYAGGNALKLEISFLFIAVLMFCLSLSQLKLLQLSDCLFTDIVNPIIISISASILLTLFFVHITGFEMFIAVKQAAVAIAVIILYVARSYSAMKVFLNQSVL